MKRYKNVGSSPIDVGHETEKQPGQEFLAALDEAQEQYFKDIGALRVLDANPGSDKKKDDD